MDIKQYKLCISIKYCTDEVAFSESHGLKDRTMSVTEGAPAFVSNIKQCNARLPSKISLWCSKPVTFERLSYSIAASDLSVLFSVLVNDLSAT